MRFFTHENNKERKKIRRIRGMETIFITRFEEAPRALLLFLETPFYFLRRLNSIRRNDYTLQVPKGTSEAFSSLARFNRVVHRIGPKEH